MSTVHTPDEAIEQLLGRLAGGTRILLAITGAPGSGKSTLTDVVRRRLAAAGITCATFPMDGFHLDQRVLDARGLAEVKGAPETFDAAGYIAMLGRIRAGTETVWAPRFDRDLEQPIAGALEVTPHDQVVITEGNYLLLQHDPWSSAAAQFDLSWHIRLDEDLRREWLIARHVSHGDDAERAHRRAFGSDERNALLVNEQSRAADLVIDPTPPAPIR